MTTAFRDILQPLHEGVMLRLRCSARKPFLQARPVPSHDLAALDLGGRDETGAKPCVECVNANHQH
jgi:hypothetical protein